MVLTISMHCGYLFSWKMFWSYKHFISHFLSDAYSKVSLLFRSNSLGVFYMSYIGSSSSSGRQISRSLPLYLASSFIAVVIVWKAFWDFTIRNNRLCRDSRRVQICCLHVFWVVLDLFFISIRARPHIEQTSPDRTRVWNCRYYYLNVARAAIKWRIPLVEISSYYIALTGLEVKGEFHLHSISWSSKLW